MGFGATAFGPGTPSAPVVTAPPAPTTVYRYWFAADPAQPDMADRAREYLAAQRDVLDLAREYLAALQAIVADGQVKGFLSTPENLRPEEDPLRPPDHP